MSFFALGKRIIGKQVDERAAAAVPQQPAQDGRLPMGARIGGLLEIPRSSFALLDGSLLKVPAIAQMQIQAISRIRLDAGADLGLFRFYTSCGEHREGVGESFLQVLVQGDDDIVNLTYYQFLFRLIPQTEEEQRAYQGDGSGLGEMDYWLGPDLLGPAGVGLSEEAIQRLLGDGDALHFLRDTPDRRDYVEPFKARETRIDDAIGSRGLAQRVWFMPYHRQLQGGNTERLLISFEVVSSIDGDAGRQQVHADFMVGFALDHQKVRII